jgi:hypothetical protein
MWSKIFDWYVGAACWFEDKWLYGTEPLVPLGIVAVVFAIVLWRFLAQ